MAFIACSHMFLSSPKALLTAYTGHQEQTHASPFISAFISSFLHLEIFFFKIYILKPLL